MKRYLIAALILLVMIAPAFAQYFQRMNEDRDVKTKVIVNTGANPIVTNVNSTDLTSGIVPGQHRVVGYEVCPNPLSAVPPTVALYDNTSMTNGTENGTSTGLFAESSNVANTSIQRTFPYPKALANGLSVLQGSNTTVTVYYERYSP